MWRSELMGFPVWRLLAGYCGAAASLLLIENWRRLTGVSHIESIVVIGPIIKSAFFLTVFLIFPRSLNRLQTERETAPRFEAVRSRSGEILPATPFPQPTRESGQRVMRPFRVIFTCIGGLVPILAIATTAWLDAFSASSVAPWWIFPADYSLLCFTLVLCPFSPLLAAMDFVGKDTNLLVGIVAALNAGLYALLAPSVWLTVRDNWRKRRRNTGRLN